MDLDKKKKYRKVFIIILFAFLWLATGQIFVKEKPALELEEAIAEVSIYNSTSQVNTVDINIPITTEALKIIDFKSERAGRIVEVRDIEGDVKGKNTLVVGLDVDDTKQALESAKANLEKSKLDLDIAKQLNKEGYRTKLELSSSEANYRDALRQYESAKVSYEQSFIKLPYKVYVDEILVEVGDYVSQGDTVARVMDLSKVNAYGYVTEKNINSVTKDTKATIHLVDGSNFEAQVNFVSRFSDSNIHTYKVGALIDSDYKIPHGMSGSMIIQTERKNTHLLSFSTLSLSSEGVTGVKALDEKDKVIFIPISGYTQTSKGIVVEGLPENIRVIISGQALASVGAKVEYTEVKSAFIADLK